MQGDRGPPGLPGGVGEEWLAKVITLKVSYYHSNELSCHGYRAASQCTVTSLCRESQAKWARKVTKVLRATTVYLVMMEYLASLVTRYV